MSESTPKNDDTDRVVKSEAASENPPKPRRGRPRVIDSSFDAAIKVFFDPSTSRRTIIKYLRMGRAARVLNDGPEFEYLIGNEETGEEPWFEIMAELGQIEDDETLRELASEICRLKLKTKDAVPALRRVRLGGAARGNPDALAGEIAEVIRNYRIRYDMTPGLIREAPRIVRLSFAEDETGEVDDLAEEGGR
jgi:hypothetical protein